MEIIKREAADVIGSDLALTPEAILDGIVNPEIRALAKQAYNDLSQTIFITIDNYAFGKDSGAILYRATVSEEEIAIEFNAEGNGEAIAFETTFSEILKRETKPHIIYSESIDSHCSVSVIDDPTSSRFENLPHCKYYFIRNGRYFIGNELESRKDSDAASEKDYDMAFQKDLDIVKGKFVSPGGFGIQLAKTLVVLGNSPDQQKAHKNFALANSFNFQLITKLNGGDFARQLAIGL